MPNISYDEVPLGEIEITFDHLTLTEQRWHVQERRANMCFDPLCGAKSPNGYAVFGAREKSPLLDNPTQVSNYRKTHRKLT
jgi:hypothetical protein